MFSDAVEFFTAPSIPAEGTAKVDPVCADRRCGENFISEGVGGKALKTIRGCLEYMRGPLV